MLYVFLHSVILSKLRREPKSKDPLFRSRTHRHAENCLSRAQVSVQRTNANRGHQNPAVRRAETIGTGAAPRSRIDALSAMANPPPLISPEIHARLEAARIARLSTLDSEGRPHLIPICFVWDGSSFYSAIDRKPKKVAPARLARLKNIEETPHVALLLDQYDEDWTRLWYVLVRGEAKLVTGTAERGQAIRRLRLKYPQYDAQMLADDAPVLRITPVRVAAWGKL